MDGPLARTPRDRLAAARAARGERAIVVACVAALEGREVSDDLLLVLGGAPARGVLAGREGGRAGYWPRVWGARGLLYVFDASAAPALARASRDESWRVREMIAKVAARHRVAEALAAIDALRGDPVPRVRAAAERAVAVILSD